MDHTEIVEKGWVEFANVLVDKGQTPMRIDKYLLMKMENVSRNRIKNAIQAGAILVNAKKIKPSYPVRPLDDIRVYLEPSEEDRANLIPEEMELDIRYEDEAIMIIHKPSGMVVHPGIGNWRGTLVNGLAHYFQNKDLPILNGNPSNRPGLVHRIDKDTSGLLVIAKTPEAMTHLGKQFFEHTIDRKYLAIIWGQPDEDEGTIIGYIGRDIHNRKKQKLYTEEHEGKYAVTHYKIVKPLYYVSLVECQLETGRTHQIRVSMESIGHPLFNDAKYGGDRIRKGTVYTKYKQFVENCFKIQQRQALHAKSLAFVHPVTAERMEFEADLPEDMQLVMDKWTAYVDNRKEHTIN